MLLKNKSLLASAVIAIFVASCAKETAVDSSDTSGDSYSEFVDSLESTGGRLLQNSCLVQQAQTLMQKMQQK